MKIFITCKPKSKKEFIKKIDETHFIVAVQEPAEKGKANRAIIKAVADYFKIAPSNIQIISGKTSSKKIIDFHVN